MRIFVTSNFSKSQNKVEINNLQNIIESTGNTYYNFVLSYPVFDDLQELWRCAKKEILLSDAILVDVSDFAVGRLIEVGIAYDAGKKIIALAKKGVKQEKSILGVADIYLEYSEINDIQQPLTDFLVTLK